MWYFVLESILCEAAMLQAENENLKIIYIYLQGALDRKKEKEREKDKEKVGMTFVGYRILVIPWWSRYQ